MTVHTHGVLRLKARTGLGVEALVDELATRSPDEDPPNWLPRTAVRVFDPETVWQLQGSLWQRRIEGLLGSAADGSALFPLPQEDLPRFRRSVDDRRCSQDFASLLGAYRRTLEFTLGPGRAERLLLVMTGLNTNTPESDLTVLEALPPSATLPEGCYILVAGSGDEGLSTYLRPGMARLAPVAERALDEDDPEVRTWLESQVLDGRWDTFGWSAADVVDQTRASSFGLRLLNEARRQGYGGPDPGDEIDLDRILRIFPTLPGLNLDVPAQNLAKTLLAVLGGVPGPVTLAELAWMGGLPADHLEETPAFRALGALLDHRPLARGEGLVLPLPLCLAAWRAYSQLRESLFRERLADLTQTPSGAAPREAGEHYFLSRLDHLVPGLSRKVAELGAGPQRCLLDRLDQALDPADPELALGLLEVALEVLAEAATGDPALKLERIEVQIRRASVLGQLGILDRALDQLDSAFYRLDELPEMEKTPSVRSQASAVFAQLLRCQNRTALAKAVQPTLGPGTVVDASVAPEGQEELDQSARLEASQKRAARGRELLSLGNAEAAANELGLAILWLEPRDYHHQGTSLRLRTERAGALIRAGESASAAKELERILHHYEMLDNDAELRDRDGWVLAWCQRGELRLDQGDAASALDDFREALAVCDHRSSRDGVADPAVRARAQEGVSRARHR